MAAYRELVEEGRARSDNGAAERADAEEIGGDLQADEPGALAHETDAALEAIRALDRHHLRNVGAVHEEFDTEWRPLERDAVARERRELAQELSAVESVVIAGGHVAVLLNRLRLFDLAPLLAGKSLVAWSAGAMAMARTVVLFHDRPPWGAGNAEVLDSGMGLIGNLLPLPDCRRRLRLEDPRRMTLLARRFESFVCVGLDEESRLSAAGSGWRARAALHCEPTGAVRLVGRSGWEGLAP